MAPPVPPPPTPPPTPPPSPPGGVSPTDLIPVWMDETTARFLISAITAALQGQNQPKGKK